MSLLSDRFAALSEKLISLALLGPDPAPLLQLDVIDANAPGSASNVRRHYRAGASQTSAEAVITGWDWTSAGQTVTLRDRAVNLLDLDPNSPQKLLRALALVTLDEINILRTAASLTPRTVAQLKTAIRGKLTAGDAD